MIQDAKKVSEKMRRVALKEQKQLALEDKNTPANYISPDVLASIKSFKGKDKETCERLVVRTLLDIIMNGENNKEKLAAIDRYQKLTQSSHMLIKSGNSTAAIETNSDQPTTLNLDLRSHISSDEPMEDMQITSRDLVAEKNNKDIEDASFEVIEG